MKSRRGSTFSPIRMRNISSAFRASSSWTFMSMRLSGSSVVSHSSSASISPKPLKRVIERPRSPSLRTSTISSRSVTSWRRRHQIARLESEALQFLHAAIGFPHFMQFLDIHHFGMAVAVYLPWRFVADDQLMAQTLLLFLAIGIHLVLGVKPFLVTAEQHPIKRQTAFFAVPGQEIAQSQATPFQRLQRSLQTMEHLHQGRQFFALQHARRRRARPFLFSRGGKE